MAGLFITATGTGIGKTAITALIARQLIAAGQRPEVLKPVLSGFDPASPGLSDAGVLLAAAGAPITRGNLDKISPWRFAAPLSPDMAAAREGRLVPFDDLVGWCAQRLANAHGPVLVEGVGGAMVPLGPCHTVLDWMAALKLPALLVSGTYLGSISHALTTLMALETRGIAVASLVLNTSVDAAVAADEMRDVLARFTDVPIRIVPRLKMAANGVPETEGTPDLTGLFAATAP